MCSKVLRQALRHAGAAAVVSIRQQAERTSSHTTRQGSSSCVYNSSGYLAWWHFGMQQAVATAQAVSA
jgi:hypothetical protein